MAGPLARVLVRSMKSFWGILWMGLACWGLLWICNTCEIYGWARLSIVAGGVAGVMYGYFWYEEIACTCDDPDHEH